MCKKFSPKCNAIITDSVDLTTRTVKRAVSLEVPIVDANLLLKGVTVLYKLLAFRIVRISRLQAQAPV